MSTACDEWADTTRFGEPAMTTTPPSPGLQPSRRRNIIIVSVLGLALLAGLIYAAVLLFKGTPTEPAAQTFTLSGTLELTSSDLDGGGGSCYGSGGYSDIAPGASVTVYDAAGAIIATGALDPNSTKRGPVTCAFRFSVPNVPSTSGFYSVEVSHRGKVTVSREEAMGIGPQLTLG